MKIVIDGFEEGGEEEYRIECTAMKEYINKYSRFVSGCYLFPFDLSYLASCVRQVVSDILSVDLVEL